MNRIRIFTAILILLASTAFLSAKKHTTKTPPSSFAYYMLVLSYAPDFCADGNGGSSSGTECTPGQHTGFVVHGLWPQGTTTRGPENCGGTGTIPASIISAMLNYFPTESLIHHEWTTHGTCSGLSVTDYFNDVKTARDHVKIPAELTPTTRQSLSATAIQSKLAAANPSYPATAFRTSCYPNHDLQEVRICLDKNLSPRACGPSAGSCPSNTLSLRPVQ